MTACRHLGPADVSDWLFAVCFSVREGWNHNHHWLGSRKAVQERQNFTPNNDTRTSSMGEACEAERSNSRQRRQLTAVLVETLALLLI
jgi:hypothetical protein